MATKRIRAHDPNEEEERDQKKIREEEPFIDLGKLVREERRFTFDHAVIKIKGQIGKGGNGRVYRAHLKGEIGMKVSRDGFVARNELFVLKECIGLQHVVQYMCHFEHEDQLYIGMELAEMSLHDYYADVRDITTIKDHVAQMLNGLCEIHRLGILHRDVKPGNFLFVGGVVKLSDFGASEYKNVRDGDLKVTTVVYRSPEIFMGCKEYDEKLDVWGLGCTVAFMVTGEDFFPYPGFCRVDAESACIHVLFDIFRKLGGAEKMSEYPYYQPMFPNSPGLRSLGLGEAEDFVRSALTVHPSSRPTIVDLMKHKWLV